MYKKNCFAYKDKGYKKICSALNHISCDGCKFYKTKQEYETYVAPLKNKRQGA